MSDEEAAGGCLEILNVGAGHLKIEFNKANPAERERAKSMVQDMIRRGYAIFVERGDKLVRVRAFDARRSEYIIKDVPKAEARVPMARAKATAVGRTAGG